jgi:hypothetical protein
VFGTDELSGLGVQLATYRMLDSWEEARQIRDDGVNSYNLTVVTMKYNELVGRFNQLIDSAEHVAQVADGLQSQLVARDQEIADLKQQLAAAHVETFEVRQKWASSDTSLINKLWAAEDELKALRSQRP